MHSFIINNSQYSILNTQLGPDILIIQPEKSVGIDEVRQIQSFLSRKPMQSPRNLVYIVDAHLLTIPAQNALLKTLEEPPGNSEIYLVTEYPDQLLPTVLSRCQQIPNHKSQITNPNELLKSQELLTKLQKAEVGERLDILDAQGFTRETLLNFLGELEWILHKRTFLGNPGESLMKLSDTIHQTRKYLKANCNLKLCLNYLATNL